MASMENAYTASVVSLCIINFHGQFGRFLLACVHSLEAMRFVQHNAAAHRTHHAGQNDKQSDAADILLVAWIVL